MVFPFPTRKAEDSKEQNEVSGSKGEANFVWRCKSCKVGHPVNQKHTKLLTLGPERVNSNYQESASSVHSRISTQEAENHRI